MTVPEVVVNLPANPWTTVAAIATCVGAVGSAAGAIAAWRAASKSSVAAQRAQAALGAAMRPQVAFETRSSDERGVYGIVLNVGDWDASDLHVRWFLVDGGLVEDSRLDLSRSSRNIGTDWPIALGRQPDDGDFHWYEGVRHEQATTASKVVDRVELEMSDSQRLQRWLVTAIRPRDGSHGAWVSSYTAVD